MNGIYCESCDWIFFTANIIYDNEMYGVQLYDANEIRVYYNDIGCNSFSDAMENISRGPVYWDDGYGLGNYWWNFNRSLSTYPITNITHTVNQDNYPQCSMWIDNASASSYEAGTIGNLVTWAAYAHNPDYYEVYDGTTLLGTGPWTGSNIAFDVDGLAVGVHDLEIIIYHITGHNLTASVEVTVADTTSPTWVSTPEDQTINYGEALSYQMSAADYSPLGTWSVNNTLFSITDGLLTNASALEPGNYRLKITVEDIYGNELSVDILIHVLSEPTTTEPTTSEPTTIDTSGGGLPPETMLLLVLGAGGAVVVIVIIVLVVKKKST